MFRQKKNFSCTLLVIEIKKYDIFKKVSTRYEMPDGAKLYGKQILNDPEKYFTKEVMDRIEEAAQKEFTYGNN